MALTKIETPDLGGATEVTVIEVMVKPGDKIAKDASIVTLESDKATMDIPSDQSGTVKEVNVKVGDKVEMGKVLVTLETDDGVSGKPTEQETKTKEEPEAKTAEKESKKVKEEPEEPEEPEATASETEQAAPLEGVLQTSVDVHAGPGVRRMAREFGVNLNLVKGSGPKERIVKEDVQAFVKQQLSQAPAANALSLPLAPAIDFTKFGPVEYKPLTRIQKISGKNLQRNWMLIPHVTQFGEADITDLEDFREEQKLTLEKQQVKFTPLVFVMKAVVGALKAFPHFNASLDQNSENLVLKNYYHIGVAVDTPDGLVVPVIRNVDKKGLIDLAKELALVSEKARKKQLTPGDMQGGCFSISSLGGIGGTAFTPIINYPEVAILGVSKTSFKPVYKDGAFVPRLILPLSLSYDHRVIDGADGARFLVYLTKMLSDIRNLLL